MAVISKYDLGGLVDLIFENKDCNKDELEEVLFNWLINKERCNCSRCTGLPDIESYYIDDEEDI